MSRGGKEVTTTITTHTIPAYSTSTSPSSVNGSSGVMLSTGVTVAPVSPRDPTPYYSSFGIGTTRLLTDSFLFKNQANVTRLVSLSSRNNQFLSISSGATIVPATAQLATATPTTSPAAKALLGKFGMKYHDKWNRVGGTLDTNGDTTLNVESDSILGYVPGLDFALQHNADVVKDLYNDEVSVDHELATRLGYRYGMISTSVGISVPPPLSTYNGKIDMSAAIKLPIASYTTATAITNSASTTSTITTASSTTTTTTVTGKPSHDIILGGMIEVSDVNEPLTPSSSTASTTITDDSKLSTSIAPSTTTTTTTPNKSRTEITDYGVGLQYEYQGVTATIKSKRAFRGWLASYYTSISSSHLIGAQMEHLPPTTSGGVSERVLTVGSQYIVDPKTTIKAKFNSRGQLAAVVQRELFPTTLASLSAQWNTAGIVTGTSSFATALQPARFGVSIDAAY